jgi:hypothetical protein
MDRYYHRYLLKRGNGTFFPGLPAYADTVAGFASVMAIQFLATRTSPVLDRLISIDFDAMQIDWDDVLRLPRCPVCSGGLGATEPPFPADQRPDLD